MSGIKPVVCINKFYTDTDAEVQLIRRLCEEHGVRCALSEHWQYGGEGALELARFGFIPEGRYTNEDYLFDKVSFSSSVTQELIMC